MLQTTIRRGVAWTTMVIAIGGLGKADAVVGQAVAPRASSAVTSLETRMARGARVARAPRTHAQPSAGFDAPLQEAQLALPQLEIFPQDPADSLYREAREELNRGNYERAATLFRRIRERFPRSDYTPDSFYWEAFALYRTGSTDRLRVAAELLEQQARAHANAPTRSQANVLATRIQGRLAAQGDPDAAQRLTETVAPLAPPPPTPGGPPSPAAAPRPSGAPRAPGDAQSSDDMRIAALNALLHMDAGRAVPILKAVLARRDAGSVELRRKAVFLVSQQRTAETEDILLDAARNDPDTEVRAQAVFWLSQVPTERAVTALDSILRGSTDRDVQKKAIFALSQHHSERAARSLRAFAERRDAPVDLRGDAIFWLGQQGGNAQHAYLRELYTRLQVPELKEKAIFAISQTHSAESQQWLLARAADRSETIDVRKKALFWAGESGVSIRDLVRLYDSMDEREIREQLIFVYSQRHESEAIDKLMTIARDDSDPELRRKAIFWLGQSGDPRVAQFLLEIINR